MILLELFLTFFKIGLFTFGGGYAMLPLIQEEIVANGWLPMEDMINFIAVSESTPGPFAINIATYVGSEVGGVLGSTLATLGVVMPSFIVILIVARMYVKFQNSRAVMGCMTGLRPAVIGLIGSAIVSTALTVFFPSGINIAELITAPFFCSIVIFALALVLCLKKLHPVLVIVLSAGLGIAAGYIFKM